MSVLLRIAAIATLLALALMVWSLVQPDVVPIMVAMSVGQGLGTLAFGAYGYVVFRDLWKRRKANRDSRQSLEFPVKKVVRDLAKPEPAAGGAGQAVPDAVTNEAKELEGMVKEPPHAKAVGDAS